MASPASCRWMAMPNTASWPSDAVELAFCWSYVRRRFYELAAAGAAAIASEALERIATLYHIEQRGSQPSRYWRLPAAAPLT